MELPIRMSEVTAKRLEALAAARGVSLESLVSANLDEFAADRKTRRTILKFRREAGVKSLTDLGWLDGYTGQSIDEILSFESTERPPVLLATIEDALRRRVKERSGWTGVERMVLSVQSLVNEVNNGGFHQFFFNSSRQHAPAITDDLRRIGCDEAANITRRAVDALGLEHQTAEDIQRVIASEGSRDRLRDPLRACDEAFYALAEDIPAKLLSYVRRHADGINI